MANTAVATPQLMTDPGFLYWAPLGTAIPINTVAGSVLTDTWPVAWIPLGMTDAGTKFTASLTVNPIEAAEVFDPLAYRTTGRATTIDFMLKNYTASVLAKAFNGATTAVTGSTATTLTKITPPTPGTEVRAMLGFESLDSTFRFIAYQVLNSGDIALEFAKAPANTNVSWSCVLEKPLTTQPWDMWTAGAGRA